MFEFDFSRAMQRLTEMAEWGLLGAFGAIASTAFTIARKKKVFKLTLFFCNVIVAVFVGNVVGAFIGESEFRDGAIMLCGFFAYPILEAAEERAKAFFGSIINRIKL